MNQKSFHSWYVSVQVATGSTHQSGLIHKLSVHIAGKDIRMKRGHVELKKNYKNEDFRVWEHGFTATVSIFLIPTSLHSSSGWVSSPLRPLHVVRSLAKWTHIVDGLGMRYSCYFRKETWLVLSKNAGYHHSSQHPSRSRFSILCCHKGNERGQVML